MRHYGSRTKRCRDLQFGPFCSYFYRPGDLYFGFYILPTQTRNILRRMALWKITCATIIRELSVVETCRLARFVAIVTVQVTYFSDLTFCPRKPQYSTTSDNVCKNHMRRTIIWELLNTVDRIILWILLPCQVPALHI